jgi:O-antigen/teichoic acid export membrane protein
VSPAPKQNLTVRASLNAAISMFTAVANIVVGLVVNPALLGALGTVDFGIWKICQRLLSFVSAAEGQSTQGLKWTIAAKQADPDLQSKRRDIASALIVWLLLLPLVAAAGGAMAWYSPSFVNDVDPSYYGPIRLACLILTVGLILMPLQAIPAAVMFGMNREYQIAWLRSVVLVFAGAGMVACAMMGWGIPGVALASVLAPLLGTVITLVIARRALPWIGVSRPRREEVKSFFGFSFWILGWQIAARFLFMSDVLVLGLVTSATTVSAFVLSHYPIQVAEIVAFNVITASMPSLGHLLSSGENQRAAKVRGEITRLTWLMTVIPGALILLFCQSFVNLWVGPENFIGQLELLLMVILCIQVVMIRNDGNIINLTLDIKTKFYIGISGGLLAFGLAYLLGGPMGYGVAGALAGLIVGRTLLQIAFPIVLRTTFNTQGVDLRTPLRMIFATLIMLGCCMLIGPSVRIDGWFVLAGAVLLASLPIIPISFFLGLSREGRHEVIARLNVALGAAMRRLRRS